jgi:hypothetical protein
MNTRPRPAQSEFLEGSLPLKPSAEAPPIRNDQLPSGRLSLVNLDPLA